MTSSVNRKIASQNALGYMGVAPLTPPNLLTYGYAPASDDNNAPIGTLWLLIDPAAPNPPSPEIWLLGSINGFNANWVQLYPGSGTGVMQIVTQNGDAFEMNSEFNILGENVITTSGSGNTVTIQYTNGSDGQLIIGGGVEPAWSSVTSTGGTVTITPGANTLNLEAVQAEAIHEIVTDSGTATEVNNIINIFGGQLIKTRGIGNLVSIGMKQGLDGQIPIGATSAVTQYANITSNDGTVFINNGPNSIDLSVITKVESGFFYYQAEDYDIPYNTQTTWYLGASQIMTKLFDINNDFYPGNGTYNFTNYPPPSVMPSSFPGRAYFTAPVTGNYLFGVNVTVLGGDQLQEAYLAIGTTVIVARGFQPYIYQPPVGGRQTISNRVQTMIYLNAGDQVYFGTRSLPNPAGTVIYGDDGDPLFLTYIWGFLAHQT
jgi:hypothetical protein